MRRLALLAIIAALAGLIGPTASGWIRTLDAIAISHGHFNDDGRRYVLEDGNSSDLDSATSGQLSEVHVHTLGEMLRARCEDRADFAGCLAAVIDTVQSTSASWLGDTFEVVHLSSLDDLIAGQGTITVIPVRSAGELLPLILGSQDELFVSGDVPGTGPVLYRRRFFDQDWANLAIVVHTGPDEPAGVR